MICKDKDCSNEFIQYRSFDKYCSLACKNKNTKKKAINPVSKSRLTQLAIYRPLRDEYLARHPKCEVNGCDRDTTNLHHKAGRIGKLLFDSEHFMACCELCHPQRIHENPEWSRENGYLINDSPLLSCHDLRQ